MSFAETSATLWFAMALQALGIMSAVLARVGQNSRYQASLQTLFLAFLATIGGTTLLASNMGPDIFVPPGLALAMMVLIAVWDFGPTRQADAARTW